MTTILALSALLQVAAPVDVPVASAPPSVDGRLDDPCWGSAATLSFARVCRDADRLYVGVAPAGRVDLAINANGDGNSFYLLSVGPDGAVQTTYREVNPPWYDVSWKPKLEAKVSASGLELALPFSIFHLNRTLAPAIGFEIRREGEAWSGRLKGIPARAFPFPGGDGPPPLALGPGSAHPGTTGEVRIELEGFLFEDPHARGQVWDLAVREKTGELYVLSVPRIRACPEIQVFDRGGKYLRTVMPFNPSLPREAVMDLAAATAVEGGTSLVLPRRFEIFGAVETSLYGEWWHFPQKMAFAPDGDLILTNLYRGTVWRLRPDGSLPKEGWTSVYNPGRNEPFESTVDIGVKHRGRLDIMEEWYAVRTDSYLPFPELFYPYLAFDRDGRLLISRGLHYKSSGLESLAKYGVFWEVPRNPERQLPDTAAVWWTLKLAGGAKVEEMRGHGFDGKEEPLPLPGGVPGRKEPGTFVGECGLAVDGEHVILSDRKDGRLRVYDAARRPVKTLEGFAKPSAMAVDAKGALYVLVDDGAKKVVKLRGWREPEVLATSAPLHREALQIAIDRSAGLLWVANGDGAGSIVQLGGDDLAVRGKWGDAGQALSSPVQQGYVPILNVDPVTGHLYVEDDSHYRFGKRGETYRLDADGKVLKRLNAVPKEMPRLETLFGRDGNLYWWEQGKIWRYDRSGKPLPFKATGSEALVVDAKVHHVGVYMGMDVDADGTIYCVTAQSKLNVYDADGTLKKEGFLDLKGAVRGIQVDDEGHLFTLSRKTAGIVQDTILEVYNASLLEVSKYSPGGGQPIWSMPWTGITGRDQVLVAGCGCLRPRLHQALDGKGYLYAAGWNSIRVIDTRTGKVVGEFGSYGNVDCRGKGSASPHPELPFGTISALAVHKDRIYVVDQLNRRIVKCRIRYGE